MEEILIALLKKDAGLLTRRDEFIDTLDAEVPPKYKRQYMAIRKALELNVGEIFALKKNDFDAAKSEVEKILKDSGMQDVHVNSVLEIFEKVLASLPSEFEKDEEDFAPTETISTHKKSNVEEKISEDVEISQPKPTPPPSQPVPTPTPPPSQPVPPPTPPPSQPTPPPTPTSSGNNKLLIGIILILIAVIGYIVGNKSADSDNKPPAQVEQTTEQSQPVQEKPAEPTPPPIREAYLDAKTDMSLNGMDVGSNFDDVKKILGKENSLKNSGGYDRYYYDNFEVAVNKGKVDAFVARNSKYKTKRGLHVGSTYAEVINAYGTNYHEMALGDLNLYEYDFTSLDGRPGLLRFAINKSDGCVNYISIRINEPEPPKKEEPKDKVDENARAAARAFVAYHEAITSENFQRAYSLMTDYRKQIMGNGMADFRRGYADTISSEITELNLVSTSADRVVMDYTLDARDRARGGTLYQQFQGQVEMVKDGGEWKINDVHSKKIKEVMNK